MAEKTDPQRRERVEFFEQAGKHTPSIEVCLDDASFLVPTRDAMGRTLFLKRRRREFAVLDRAVAVVETLADDQSIRGTFVDVGANIGTATVRALASHGFESAVACEPEPDSFRLLRANLALNGLGDRAQLLRVAASNRVGRSKLVVPEGLRGSSWLAEDRTSDPSVTTSVEVDIVTLDSLAENGVIADERVGMLWIDAQGHEGQILSGASAMTERGVPVVAEFHPAGLDEHGDRDMLNDIAAARYTHFIDMRRAGASGEAPDFHLCEVSDLPAYAEHLLEASTPWEVTDLLFVRLTREPDAAAGDLGDLVRRRLRSSRPG